MHKRTPRQPRGERAKPATDWTKIRFRGDMREVVAALGVRAEMVQIVEGAPRRPEGVPWFDWDGATLVGFVRHWTQVLARGNAIHRKRLKAWGKIETHTSRALAATARLASLGGPVRPTRVALSEPGADVVLRDVEAHLREASRLAKEHSAWLAQRNEPPRGGGNDAALFRVLSRVGLSVPQIVDFMLKVAKTRISKKGVESALRPSRQIRS